MDWYLAKDAGYLENLEVLDGDMAQATKEGAPLTFSSLAPDFDYIIGSDLLYFSESVAPLFEMLTKLFELSKKPNLIFYMCMMRRAKELHDQLSSRIATSKFTAELVDEEYITALGAGAGAYLYKI